MKTYYTIFLGDNPWENCIDDMNSGAVWGMGNMYWDKKSKAIACMKNLKNPAYGFEDKTRKFHVVSFSLPIKQIN